MFSFVEIFDFFDLLNFLGQLPESAAEGAKTVEKGGETSGNSGGLFGGQTMMFLLPIMAVLVVYMMLMGRPQKKEQAKRKELLESLKKNDRVLTAGGIQGTVANIQSDNEFITLRIDESSNAKIKILRSSIVRVLTDDDKKGVEAETK